MFVENRFQANEKRANDGSKHEIRILRHEKRLFKSNFVKYDYYDGLIAQGVVSCGSVGRRRPPSSVLQEHDEQA
jgi:hypothetical protein